MARIRSIKPTFFLDEEIANLPLLTRLLFIGLWTIADSEGRLEDRPKRIKVQTHPYDDGDTDAMLQELHNAKFITRYEVAGGRFIEIAKFKKHQRLTGKEAETPSAYPPIPTQITPDTPQGNNRETTGKQQSDDKEVPVAQEWSMGMEYRNGVSVVGINKGSGDYKSEHAPAETPTTQEPESVYSKTTIPTGLPFAHHESNAFYTPGELEVKAGFPNGSMAARYFVDRFIASKFSKTRGLQFGIPSKIVAEFRANYQSREPTYTKAYIDELVNTAAEARNRDGFEWWLRNWSIMQLWENRDKVITGTLEKYAKDWTE
ncbi:MAG: hypothetical protein HUU10_04180 [Bacteroidetes bacterium]|nr:hypothetical protein [Bacteroidota bacterium]